MDKLKNTKKITLATLKSFAKRNRENLLVREESDFNGMIDMVERNENASFRKTELDLEKTGYYKTGIQGAYTVGRSNDRFGLYEDEKYIGINIYNCCGSSTVVTEK